MIVRHDNLFFSFQPWKKRTFLLFVVQQQFPAWNFFFFCFNSQFVGTSFFFIDRSREIVALKLRLWKGRRERNRLTHFHRIAIRRLQQAIYYYYCTMSQQLKNEHHYPKSQRSFTGIIIFYERISYTSLYMVLVALVLLVSFLPFCHFTYSSSATHQ